jgi:Raf kinase inhibitor-like YbhB/YbcL family protein
MRLWSDSFKDGGRLPELFALAKPHPVQHAQFSDNLNPHLAWDRLPKGTESLALLVHDTDAPSSPEDVNREGRSVPFSLPRTDFFHWVLVDLSPDFPVQEGEFSRGVVPKGKPGPQGPRGTRQGLNDYTGWFKGNPGMEGLYFGYDGAGPPWNDERVHHYFFTLYALRVGRFPAEGEFNGPSVLNKMEGIVLESARIRASYSIFPDAR